VIDIIPNYLTQRHRDTKKGVLFLSCVFPTMLFFIFLIKKKQEENDTITNNIFVPSCLCVRNFEENSCKDSA
jgi:hypothetical protein